MVKNTTGTLGFSFSTILSFLFFFISLVVALKMPQWLPRFFQAQRGMKWGGRIRALSTSLGILIALLLLRQSPIWFKWKDATTIHEDSVVASQILTVWFNELFSDRYDSYWGKGDQLSGNPTLVLASYRDYQEDESGRYSPVTQVEPLYRNYGASEDQAKRWRSQLGLPQEGQLNVVILFVESLRAYEVMHPVLGKEVTPNLRKLFDGGSIAFSQAYSSSFKAGQTVRGQFSTLCSMLPNVIGPAAYIAFSTVSIECLPSVLKDRGYQTIWMNPNNRTFHNKFIFESRHGMQTFYDETHFDQGENQ